MAQKGWSLFPHAKRGITPIISIILLVAITLAAAGSFYFWYSRVQQGAQGRAEQSTSTFLHNIGACVKFPYFTYNLLTNRSEVQVKNCGSTSITIGDGNDNILISSEACAFTVNSQICDNCPLTIGPGALAKFSMDFNEATCSGSTETAADILSDQGGIQHRITFSLEGATTTAAKDFIPEITPPPEYCSVDLSGPSDMYFKNITGLLEKCATYNITLLSDKAHTFDITYSPGPPAPGACVSVGYYTAAHVCGILTDQIIDISLQPGNTSSFVLDYARYATDPLCNITTILTATDFSSCDAQSKLIIKIIGGAFDWLKYRHDASRVSVSPLMGAMSTTPSMKTNYSATSDVDSNVVVGDTDEDGELEVLFGDQTTLYCYNTTTGALRWSSNEGSLIRQVEITYNNHNGPRREIVAASLSNISAFDYYGNKIWSKPISSEGFSTADINDDGDAEIVSIHGNNIIALNGSNGNTLWTKGLDITSPSYGVPAVADLYPSMPGLEIVFGYWLEPIIWALNSTGDLIWSYTSPYPGATQSTPALADINNDTNIEIAFIEYRNTGSRLFVLNKTGSPIWNYSLGSITGIDSYDDSGPAVADIYPSMNGLEIAVIVPDYGQNESNNSIIVFNSTGQKMWSYPIGTERYKGEPVIFDVDGDGDLDVIGSGEISQFAIDGQTGTLIWSYTSTAMFPIEGKAIADFDGDNKGEFSVTYSYSPFSYGVSYIDV